jgi:CheY-like chemotaxis protein
MDGAPTVLIAEDFPDFRQRLLAVLEPLALSCVMARNGREAIDVLRDVSRDLHLLITDMDMPVHNGWEVVEEARLRRGPALPIVMQTGEAKYTYVRRRAEEFGIVLIDKTDIHDRLVPAVRHALSLAPPARRGRP